MQEHHLTFEVDATQKELWELFWASQRTDLDYEGVKIQILHPGDEIGKTGVEQAYEKVLRGKPGRTIVEVDPRGVVLRTLEHEDPVQGHDLYLTIDPKTAPSSAVVVSHRRVRCTSPRWAADTASTIVSELMSSTNELTEVNGMS